MYLDVDTNSENRVLCSEATAVNLQAIKILRLHVKAECVNTVSFFTST